MDSSTVIDILYSALRAAKSDLRINDVTRDGDHNDYEIALTTDDGTRKQVWVIAQSKIVETEKGI